MSNVHFCEDESYPGGKIVCLCCRGINHPEDLFDVPVGEEEDEEVSDQA